MEESPSSSNIDLLLFKPSPWAGVCKGVLCRGLSCALNDGGCMYGGIVGCGGLLCWYGNGYSLNCEDWVDCCEWNVLIMLVCCSSFSNSVRYCRMWICAWELRLNRFNFGTRLSEKKLISSSFLGTCSGTGICSDVFLWVVALWGPAFVALCLLFFLVCGFTPAARERACTLGCIGGMASLNVGVFGVEGLEWNSECKVSSELWSSVVKDGKSTGWRVLLELFLRREKNKKLNTE